MRKICLLVMTAFYLSSCIESQEAIIARNSKEAAQKIEDNKKQYCIDRGAPPDSDKYAACRQWIEQQLANEATQQKAAEQQVDPDTQGLKRVMKPRRAQVLR